MLKQIEYLIAKFYTYRNIVQNPNQNRVSEVMDDGLSHPAIFSIKFVSVIYTLPKMYFNPHTLHISLRKYHEKIQIIIRYYLIAPHNSGR